MGLGFCLACRHTECIEPRFSGLDSPAPLFQPDVEWTLGNAPCCIGPGRGCVQLAYGPSPEQTSWLCLGITLPLTPQSRTFTQGLFYKPCQGSKYASFASHGAMQRPRHSSGISAKDTSTGESHRGEMPALGPHPAQGLSLLYVRGLRMLSPVKH